VGEALGERVVHGAGLVGTLDRTEYRVGSARLFDPEALTADVHAAIERIEAAGGTTVLVGTDDTIHGAIGFADTPREHAAAALHDLRRHGIDRFVMLSGDRSAAATEVARGFGITDVRAGLLPEDKLAAIGDLRGERHVVAMIGDGVNDAPSLAAADVGVAMGVAGSDAAVETADIALMGDDLRGLAQTIRLGRRTRRIIAINIGLAIATKAVFLTLAVTGNATLWMAIAADMGTSLVVIANGLRLLRPVTSHASAM
jgi:Cd2+/Zn2+-exporting ATPase